LILPPHPTPLRIFRRGKRQFFVAEVVRLRKRFMAHVRILTNPATKILNGVPPHPHPNPLPPVENVSSWKINRGGRGDNRKKILSFICDRVKYIPH